MRLNAGHRSIGLAPAFLVINCTILGMCCLALCPVYVPANLLGSGFIDFNKGFTGLLSLIAKARATGNIGLLANASTYMDNLGRGQLGLQFATVSED